jgi:curli biogenesis system outer membrane secretion channel CsgG
MVRIRSVVGTGSLLLAVLAGSAVAQTRPQDRPGIAVFPLDFGGSLGDKSEGLERLSIGLQQLLLNHFLQNPSIRIVERSRLKEIMDEQGLAQAGRVDAQTAAKIGKLVGARYMVMGGFAELPDMELSARIVDTETSEIIYSRRVSGKRDKVMGLVTDLAGQIEQGIKGLPARRPKWLSCTRRRWPRLIRDGTTLPSTSTSRSRRVSRSLRQPMRR